MPSAEPTGPFLDLRDVTKRYPGVLANDRVSFTLDRGEVLGVLGESGAGKSTVMNIVAGLVRPDEGEIWLDGRRVEFRSPGDAIAAGIGMVHQQGRLVAGLTVVENVVLGDRRAATRRHGLARLARRLAVLSDEIGLPVDPFARVGTLGNFGRQRVEILRACYRDARLLILDEPVARLSQPETERLFGVIRRLRQRGMAVLLVSDKLDDIRAVCDRVVVMRQGRLVDQGWLGDLTPEALARAVVGADLSWPLRPIAAPAPGRPLLALHEAAVRRDDGAMAVEDVSFELRRGEILALAGVDGNGQRELVEAIAGLRPLAAGVLDIGGLRSLPIRELRRAGLGYVPEDRQREGLVDGLSLTDNFLLSHCFSSRYNRLGWLSRRRVAADVAALIERFAIPARGPADAIGTLGPGDQQRLVLARELAGEPGLLVAAHPTRGLDLRSMAFVQSQLLECRAAGAGILLVSADLPEIWRVADRVMVAANGRLRGPVPLDLTSMAEIGSWMGGL